MSLIQLVGEYLFAQRTKDDQRIVEALADEFSDYLVSYDAQSLYAAATAAARSEQSRVLVLDSLCVVQVDSASQLNGTRFITRQVESVLEGEVSDYGIFDDDAGQYWLRAALSVLTPAPVVNCVYARGIYSGGALNGVLVYISQVQEIYDSLSDILLKMAGWILLVALAVLVVSALLLRTVTRPIGELNRGIAQMAKGDLTARVSVKGRNEFSDLAAAFNSMSRRLQRLDQSRSQFVSNASHELKTPLSTMKILIQTLMFQDPPDLNMTKEFLTDIDREIDRLDRVVSDLLTLVKIDNGAELNLTDLDIGALLQEQVKRLTPLAREHGIELEYDIKDSIPVNGDETKLQQVVYNIIDNAIKYTPRGGEVHCALTRSGKMAVIRITDTGVGIPAEDLPHIFDRFYRVDKARSRETGGTGLGLSIVQHFVKLHGGEIRADSTLGKGSSFIIELPISSKKGQPHEA